MLDISNLISRFLEFFLDFRILGQDKLLMHQDAGFQEFGVAELVEFVLTSTNRHSCCATLAPI